MSQSTSPQPELPRFLEGYGLPQTTDLLVDWHYVLERLTASRNYWAATIHPNGHPHVRPVWGVVVEDTLYIGGGSHTRWARNLKKNPTISINLEDGENVIIIEGRAVYITDDAALIAKTDAAYMEKYNIPHGPVWQIRPKTMFAWQDGISSMTRFRF